MFLFVIVCCYTCPCYVVSVTVLGLPLHVYRIVAMLLCYYAMLYYCYTMPCLFMSLSYHAMFMFTCVTFVPCYTMLSSCYFHAMLCHVHHVAFMFNFMLLRFTSWSR